MGQRLHVFRKARPPIPYTSIQEMVPNALVISHADSHFLHVGTQLLTDAGYFVDERNARGQESVGGILDHLGRAQVGNDDGGAQGQVEFGHLGCRFPICGAQHNAVWVQEVLDGTAFPQKFRVAHHPEGHVLQLVTVDDVGHPVARADGHCALVHDDDGMFHRPRDALGRHAHVLQVGFTVNTFRSAHCYENKVGLGNGLLIRGGEVQPASGGVAAYHFFQARLVNGYLVVAQHLDFAFVNVQTNDSVAQVGQTCARYQAHITSPHNSYTPHDNAPSCVQFVRLHPPNRQQEPSSKGANRLQRRRQICFSAVIQFG